VKHARPKKSGASGRKRRPPQQTWEERTQAAQLNRMADRLLGIPFTVGSKPATLLFNPRMDEPLRPLLLGDAERWQIANYLRSLTNPAILRALRRAQAPTKKRGRKTDGARLWKAALEMKVSKRPKDTAAAWKLGRSRLYEISAELTRRQRRCLPGHWRYWAAYELRVFRAAHRGMSPQELRAAFIKKLRSVR